MRELICTITFVILCISLTWGKQTDTDLKTVNPKTSTGEQGQDEGVLASAAMKEIMNVCNESFRVEMAYIEALDKSGSFPDETDRTPKCYLRCMLEKAGVASEEGVYDPKMAATVFAGKRGGKVMNDLEDLAKGCAMRDEPCKCERAYQFAKCLMEKEIEEYEKPE